MSPMSVERGGKTFGGCCHLGIGSLQDDGLPMTSGNWLDFMFLIEPEFSDFLHAFFGLYLNFSLESSKHYKRWTFLLKLKET